MTTTGTLAREQVLEAARIRHAAAVQAEIDKLRLAVEWAALNPGEPVDESVDWAERDLEVAGPGAPTVAEFAIAEFALTIALNTDQGQRYLGDAVELAHRLPTTWRRVLAGEVAAWKARKVAQATRSLPIDAAAYVDREIAPYLHRCSFAQIERTVEAARAEFDPEAAEERRCAEAEQRRFDVHLRHATSTGLVQVEGMLDLADALALHETITAKAATLDPALPLDVRRSMAAGMLGGDGVERQVVVYAHTHADTGMVEIENTRTVITPEQLREWCQAAGTTVTVRPILDLGEELAARSYEPTDRQREQARLRHPCCVFPGCGRPTRRADTDHIAPWPRGRTTSQNLAPLCRLHHRYKTHGGWTYRRAGSRTFLWTPPHGHQHVVESDRHIR